MMSYHDYIYSLGELFEIVNKNVEVVNIEDWVIHRVGVAHDKVVSLTTLQRSK